MCPVGLVAFQAPTDALGNRGARTRCPCVESGVEPVMQWVGTDEPRLCGVGGSDVTADEAIAVGPGNPNENVPAHMVVTAIPPGQSIATHFAAQH